MKLRLRTTKGSRHTVEIDPGSTFYALYERVAAISPELNSEDFFLSLNGTDPLSPTDESQKVSEFLVSGDLLWLVLLTPNLDPTFSQSRSDTEQSSTSFNPRTSQDISSGTCAVGDRESRFQTEDLEVKWDLENDHSDAGVNLIRLAEIILGPKGLKAECSIDEAISQWRATEKVTVRYKSCGSDLLPEISLRKMGFDGSRIEVSAYCQKGDFDQIQLAPLFFQMKQFESVGDSFSSWMKAVGETLEKKLLEPLTDYAIGNRILLLRVMNAMPDWARDMLMALDAKDCCRLERASKEMKRFTRVPCLWHHYIRRDFPTAAADMIARVERDGGTFRDAYIRRLEEKRESERESVLVDMDVERNRASLERERRLLHRNPPENVPFPGIGGPDDLFGAQNPFGIPNIFPNRNPNPVNPFPNPMNPNPFGPPGGPRYRPSAFYPPEFGKPRGNFPPDGFM